MLRRAAASLRDLGHATRQMTMLAPTPLRLQQEQDIRDLNDFAPTLIEELKEESKICNIPSETAWLGKLLEHTVPGGKRVRPIATYNAMRELGPKDGFTGEYLHKAKALAWSIELIHIMTHIADDIADGALTWRGRTCWYKLAGPGAVFDVLLMEHCGYRILRRHFYGEGEQGERYRRIVQTCLNILFQGIFGQNHDMHCTNDGRPKFSDFNLERYRSLCEFKSAEYSFYMPTAVAMLARGLNSPATHKAALDLASDIGFIYQIQNDYLDIYGIVDKVGKEGTDIPEGKCTWFIAEAKRRSSETQLQELEANYGFDDPAKVTRVKEIYEELQMKNVFLEYEQKSFDKITEKIGAYSRVLPPQLYTYVLEGIKYHVNR